MQKKIKCGVIGAGWWATFAHIPALLTHPNAELVAIQNNDPVEAQRISRDFGIPIACSTTAELLAIEDLSAVVISSSPNLHFADATATLSQGKHLLIEKPMTHTAAQAARLVQLADEHQSVFLMSCPWHYTVHGTEARRLIRSGALGKIRLISVLMTNPINHLLRGIDTAPTHGTSAPYMHPRMRTYSDPAIAGGGQVYAQVSHAAAYLTFLTGARPQEVFARFHNDGAAIDIYDAITLRMDDSSIVTIASTGATSLDRKDFEVRVFGTDGMLFLDLWNGRLEFVPMSGPSTLYPDLDRDAIYPHQAPANNLIDSILDPSRNQSPAIYGLAAMEVIEGASRSAASGQNISVASLLENQTRQHA